MSFFQWNSGEMHLVWCEKDQCRHGKVYWAWDRSIGAWVHYRR